MVVDEALVRMPCTGQKSGRLDEVVTALATVSVPATRTRARQTITLSPAYPSRLSYP